MLNVCVVAASGFVALLVLATPAAAQTYPSKPIRVINPAAPGGNSDIVFRVIAPKMGELVGQQFVLDYRAGAGGVLFGRVRHALVRRGQIVAKVAADGEGARVCRTGYLLTD